MPIIKYKNKLHIYYKINIYCKRIYYIVKLGRIDLTDWTKLSFSPTLWYIYLEVKAMNKKTEVFSKIKGGLIVSCQALDNEPLYSSYIMSRMAYAAQLGGACGIRANSPEDITKIKLDEFFKKIRSKYPDMIFMGDCSCLEDGIHAEKLGFDLVGTTLCGYTNDTQDTELPNISLMKQLTSTLKIPVIAEGGIWSPEELKAAIDSGVHAAVVGTAITRPMEITKRFVNAIKV